MKRRFFAGLIALFLLIGYLPGTAYASNAFANAKRLNISTLDNRPLSVDRLLYEAFLDIGVLTTNATAPTLQAGFDLTNNGERDAVTSAVTDTDMLARYPYLRKVPVVLEEIYVNAYAKKGSDLEINSWEDLSGLRVGVLAGLVSVRAGIPDDAQVFTSELYMNLVAGLENGEYDVMLRSVRLHETPTLTDGIVPVGSVHTMNEYLYLHQKHESLIPEITASLERMFTDGRAEKILSDTPTPERYMKKTVLHIISSTNEVQREEDFGTRLRELMSNDTSIEWYHLALNARCFSDELTRLNYYASLLRQDCVSRQISAIVVSGDEALAFVKEYYYTMFRNVPVLFYGIGEYYETEITGYEPYFTGVVEQLEAFETLSALLNLFPKTENVLVINDFTPEGWYYRSIIMRQLGRYTHKLNITYNEDTGRDALLQQIMSLPPDSVILVGSYFRDAAGQYFSLNDMKRVLARTSKVPIASVYSTGPEYNAIGGKCLNYEQYAEVIAGMLKRVLVGENPADIPIVVDSQQYNKWVFDKDLLKEWGILNSRLPAGSIIVNRMPGLWETNPLLMISICFIVVISIAVIIGSILVVYHFRKKTTALNTAKEMIDKDNKIREVKERLERIINTAPISFMLIIDGETVEINENMHQDTGLTTGRMISHIFVDAEQRTQILNRLAQGETIRKETVPVRFSDGEIHRCLVNVTTTDYDGQNAVIVWAFDMEKEEIQKEQMAAMHESLRTVLDSLPVPVRITDVETKKIIYMNNNCMEMFEIDSRSAAYEMSIYDLLPEQQESGNTSRVLMDRMLNTTETVILEIENKTTSGQVIDAQIVSCKIDYNGRLASVGIIKDLTEEKAYKRMLLNTAEKEKEANQLKSRFLVNMSHEIRTPMNAIIGLTDIALYKNEPGPALDVFKKINASAHHLLQLINDILDFSKIEADRMDMVEEEFCLEDVLSSAMLVAVPRLGDKEVSFMLDAALDLPSYIYGDRTRLWQVLKNFLDNSAKYTENGSVVLNVSVENEQSNDNQIVLQFIIRDTGIGISKDNLTRIFLPYQQIYNEAQKKYTGTGLGMPISKQLCEKMGGTMHIDSVFGEGTTITMTIPFRRSANSETVRQSVYVPILAHKSMLVVNNDALSLSVMTGLLACNNVAYETAEDGQTALSFIHKYHNEGRAFDLVLLDYKRDGLNGFEMASQIRALAPSTKILMVTSYESSLLKADLSRNGIDDLLQKPFIPTHFIHKICALLGHASLLPQTGSLMQFENAKVLLCEDNLLNQEVAAGMCEQFGVKPVVADNGKTALEILEAHASANDLFDLVFMDLQMPVMDGYEAAQAIRRDPRFTQLPIVSLTADAMPEIVAKCMNAGMNDHIAKPVSFDGLQRVFLKWLPEHKQRSEEPVKVTHDKLSRFGGSQAHYDTALRSFITSMPEPWPGYDQITPQLVHDIKGMAGNLSLDEVHRSAIAYESTLRRGEPDLDLYEKMIEAVERVRVALPPEVTRDKPTQTGTAAELRKLLETMKEALTAYDPSASTEAAEALSAKNWPNADPELLRDLCEKASEYAFFEAWEAWEALWTTQS